jgi:hypothetical protein
MEHDRLWACHKHEMIGTEAEALRHADANDGCNPEQLSAEISAAVRAEWRKEATRFDPALAVMLAERAVTNPRPRGSTS